jgi:NAD(P)H-hydrate epimerase
VYINPTGNAGMASGGMGDVLAGILAGMLAQGLGPEEALKLGVFLHGYVGDQVASSHGEIGLIASDLVEGLPQGIQQLKGNRYPSTR